MYHKKEPHTFCS